MRSSDHTSTDGTLAYLIETLARRSPEESQDVIPMVVDCIYRTDDTIVNCGVI